MPTLGSKSKEDVKKYILEIYDIFHQIAPINETGTDSINKDWRVIARMANLANAITRDFNAACHEIELLEAELCRLKSPPRAK